MVQACEDVFIERVGYNLQIIKDTTHFSIKEATAVAIGKFDGIHIGHKRLLQEILAKKESGLKACVFTFDPPPAVLFGYSDGKELTTREEKRKLFEQMGVDILIEYPLTKESAAIEPEDFVKKVLAEQMNTKFIVAGSDLSFGNKGAGNADLLVSMAPELLMEVKTIDKVCVDGAEVSSTRVRALVEEGKMQAVQALLGEPYTIVGTVVHGNKIGRTLGFPTVNLLPEKDKLLPPNGVYYSQVFVRGQWYKAISNVGCKPTVSDEPIVGVESYLYDFAQDIYDENVTVALYEFARPEMRFDSLEQLKEQLQKDIVDGKIWK